MTSSAPTDRTRSSFDVLHTPVTSAPSAFAICTANVPTPPPAPTISTFCPGRTFALSRSAWRAVTPEIGTAAASSNERLSGLGTSFSGRVSELREGTRLGDAHHLVAGPERRTAAPTAATVPATSQPRTWTLGLRNPIARRAKYG